MPVLKDTATLNVQLQKWCEENCPRFLSRIIIRDWNKLIKDIAGKDLMVAVRKIEKATDKVGNEDLIISLWSDRANW